MSRSLLFPILLLLLFVAAVQPAHGTIGTQVVPIEFTERVNRYVEIHRAAAAVRGPEVLCSDPEELLRQVWTFTAAIREARPAARAGDIFTPRVADFFRAHIGVV